MPYKTLKYFSELLNSKLMRLPFFHLNECLSILLFLFAFGTSVVSGKEEMRKQLKMGVAARTSGYGIDCSSQMKALSFYCEKTT